MLPIPNAHPSEAYKPRIFHQDHQERLARAALKDVPGATSVINRTFSKQYIQPVFKPAPTKDLIYHLGF